MSSTNSFYTVCGLHVFFNTTNINLFVAPIPSPAIEEGTLRPIPPNPCTPSPCGPNSQCQVVSGQAQCGCVTGMIGSVPNCRPECLISSECSSNSACINQKCVDPCVGTCAANSECRVINHSPVCSCAAGYSGDGFSSCQPVPVIGKMKFMVVQIESYSFVFQSTSFAIMGYLAKLFTTGSSYFLGRVY